MASIASRSASAGWTISAASTPSSAPAVDQPILPPPPSSAGVPRISTRPPELVGQRGGGQAGAEAGGGDDVVAAGVADAGQGVVLAQHGDRRARRTPARAANAVSSPAAERVDGQALALEDPGEQVVGEVLLEAELGVRVDLVRHVEQHVGPPVDLGGHAGLGVGSVAGSIPSRYRSPGPQR